MLVDVGAPQTGRHSTRINWLLRQLKNAPDSITLESWAARSRTSLADVIASVRSKPELLIPQDNRDIVKFTVSLTQKMGLKRAAGKRSFIDSVIDPLDDLYADVVQSLKKWQPPAPKMDPMPVENKPAPARQENENADVAQDTSRDEAEMSQSADSNPPGSDPEMIDPKRDNQNTSQSQPESFGESNA